MQQIYIREVDGRVRISINGIIIDDPHGFCIEYVKGMPMVFSCATDLTDGKKEKEMYS